jgi:hypothetical protein
MSENRLKQEDSDKLVRLLKFVATHARFNLSTQEIIEYFGLLSWAQQTLKPKIEANILEINKVIEAPTKSRKSK